MSNPPSPQQAFADLLRQKAAPRASRLSADSEPARETRRPTALSPQQTSMEEHFAARLAAIAREKATEQSRISRRAAF
jgi:hypothetical protein